MSSNAVPSDPASLAEASAADTPVLKSSRRLITAACMLVMVLASMEQTVTSTAMPTIIGSLHGLEHYAWVASIYLLCCTVSMPLYGRLADTLGRKKVLLFSIAVFLLASLLASTAHSMLQLIAYRGLQGLGAGGIMPTVLTLLGDIFTLEERAKIQGAFSAIWGTSSLAGPALGALLVKTLGWRSIFFVNIPPGLIAAAVLVLYYHEHKGANPHVDAPVDPSLDPQSAIRDPRSLNPLQHIDLPGFASLSLASCALLIAVSLPFSVFYTPALLLLCVAGAAYFIRHERRAPDPLIPLDLVSAPAIWPCLAGSLVLGIGFLSLDTYVPLFVQGARGGDATSAASVVTPVMLAWAISGIFSAPLVVKWGFQKTSVMGSALVIVGFLGLLTCAAANTPTWILTAALAITGFGLGPASMSYLLAAQGAVSWSQRGTVTSSIQLTRTLGGAFGIGLLGALFNLLSRPLLTKLTQLGYSPASLLDPATHHQIPHDVLLDSQHAIAHSLLWVFAAMLAFAGLQLLISLKMPHETSDHKISAAEALEAMAG